MVAYFRLKVNSNTSTGEVARISVKGGGTEYGPLSLRGTDFTAPGQYQEFPINFTFNSNPDDAFLTFQFWQSGSADVYVDAVSIFTAPQAVTSPLTWSLQGGNYRGQGVWVRYTDGRRFSGITEAVTTPGALHASPASLTFLAVRNGSLPPASTLNITRECSSNAWQAGDDASWLQTQAVGNTLRVGVDQSGLQDGQYAGTITISAVGTTTLQPVSIPVQLIVGDAAFPLYLPFIQR
jgi:hypothetical protein